MYIVSFLLSNTVDIFGTSFSFAQHLSACFNPHNAFLKRQTLSPFRMVCYDIAAASFLISLPFPSSSIGFSISDNIFGISMKVSSLNS